MGRLNPATLNNKQVGDEVFIALMFPAIGSAQVWQIKRGMFLGPGWPF